MASNEKKRWNGGHFHIICCLNFLGNAGLKKNRTSDGAKEISNDKSQNKWNNIARRFSFQKTW